jgi:hypothetical protein
VNDSKIYWFIFKKLVAQEKAGIWFVVPIPDTNLNNTK